MPELPEVQTVINSIIRSGCLNHKIIDIHSTYLKVFKNCNFDEFKNTLLNSQIKDIERIGKYLIFHLNNNYVFVSHLRMEGKWFYEPSSEPYEKRHVLVRIVFDNNYELRYHDTRRFGTFTIYKKNEYLLSSELNKLGYDPLQKEFNWEYLKNKISKSNSYIKTLLLKQENVSGIGNIYADEILFASKISPWKKGKDLIDQDYKNIETNASRILKSAIENEGTTIATFFHRKGKKGSFQNLLKVYFCDGKECKECKTIILKSKINGRGTHYCPKCQNVKE